MTTKALHGNTIFKYDHRSLRYLHNRMRELKIGLSPLIMDGRIYFYDNYCGHILFSTGPDFSFPNCALALKAAKEIADEIPF